MLEIKQLYPNYHNSVYLAIPLPFNSSTQNWHRNNEQNFHKKSIFPYFDYLQIRFLVQKIN